MVDNSDDKKREKKDIANFGQVINFVNDISKRVKEQPNPVTFASLRGTLIGVVESHPEIAEFANLKEIVEKLERDLEAREEELRLEQLSKITEDDRAREVAREIAKPEKLQAEMLRYLEVTAIYQKFDSFHLEYLAEQRADNENLDKVSEATQAGRELTDAEKKEFIKTHEQIEKEKLKWQHIERTGKEANIEEQHCSEHIERINNQLNDLDINHRSERAVGLRSELEHYKHRRNLAKNKQAEYAEHYHERKEDAKKVCKGLELAEQKGVNKDVYQGFAERLHEIHGISAKDLAKEESTEILPPQQKSKATDFDKQINKQDKRAGKLQQILGGEEKKKGQLQKNANSITPDPTPNLKANNLNKVKSQDTGKAGRS